MASEKSFSELMRSVFLFQYQNNLTYRRFCQSENQSPQTVRDWRRIPAIPASAFKHHRLTSFDVKKAVRVFKTSGTTQEGSRGEHFFDSLKLYKASCLASFKSALVLDKKKRDFFFLMASPAELKDSSLSWMMGLVDRHFSTRRRGSFYVKKGVLQAERLIRDFQKAKKPVSVMATAFSLAALVDELSHRDMRVSLPRGSRLMETGGFKGRSKEISKHALYEKVKKYLGVFPSHCVSEYGMTELSSQFYVVGGEVFKNLPWTRVRVVDPVTGEEVKTGRTGLIRIWDAANTGSVAVIQTEDRGMRVAQGFRLLGRAPKAPMRGCSLTYEAFSKNG